MRFLIELGSPESVYQTVFCCSHVIIACFFFLVLDVTLTLWSMLFELYVTMYHNMPNEVWVFFYALSLITSVSGGLALCDLPAAIFVYGGRICLILGLTIVRFIVSINEISTTEEPATSELLNLFQIIPVVVYTVGVFLVIRLFSYSTGIYRGYYDVDSELRKEVKRKFAEFEACPPSTTTTTTSRKTD